MVRPSVTVLVVATDDFADWRLVADVLLETCYDVSEAFGPEYQVVLRLLGGSEFDHHVANWVAAHGPTTTDTAIRVYATAHPADRAEHGDGAVWARDRDLIAQGAQLCLAFCAPGDPLPAIARFATGAGIPVRRV
ncbi:hypothetical protein [Streptomyces sp. NPDC048577]|uniref:hypothetical protein n=1 Tax=Streptomyces sp. NPDC048577 TaxID=3157209 RepID=UPI003421CA01